MKIGFDGKRAVRNHTGLGNYSRLVVEVLARAHPDDEFVLYAPKLVVSERLKPVIELPNVSLVGPDTAAGRRFSSYWRVNSVTSQLRRDGIDLYHGLSNELPLNIKKGGIPSVVTIHDVIFRHFPQYYKPIDRKIYDYKFRRAALNATRVIAISRATARDIVNLYGVDPQKIDIIYQGCHSQFRRPVGPAACAEARRRYGLDFPYIIGVGTIEERKNQLLSLEALRALPGEVKLVLVGRSTPYARKIAARASELGLSDRLHIIEGADFALFPALYKEALAAVYPSRYEGFGIPVIEALSVGCPVVVASGSCLEEAAGPDAPVVSPDDSDALAAALNRLIDDTDYRNLVAERGRIHALTFSDDTLAEQIYQTYHKALCQSDF